MVNSRAESFVRYGSRYGYIKMFRLFTRFTSFKMGLSKSIKVDGYGRFKLRQNSTDLPTLRQIFLDEEYRIHLGNPKVIFDLGANVGFSTVYFHRRFPKALILALEPDAGNFELLKMNCRQIEQIVPLQKAIWSHDGEIYLDDRIEYGEWGTRVTDAQMTKRVEAISVQTLMQQFKIEQIDVMKVDIETAEEQLFLDCDWLNKVKILVIETHDRFQAGSSNSLIRAIARLPRFNLEISGENIVVYNINHTVDS